MERSATRRARTTSKNAIAPDRDLLDRIEQGMEMLGLSGQEIEETLGRLRAA